MNRQWMFEALGFGYSSLLPLAALVSFVVTLALVIWGRGVNRGFAILLIAPLPFLIGLYAGLQGLIASYAVIANATAAPKPAEWAAGYGMALWAPMLGMILSSPAYLIAFIGLTIQSFAAEKNSRDRSD
jgi:hypothetical protein